MEKSGIARYRIFFFIIIASDFIMIENANKYAVTMYDMSGRVVLEEKTNDGRINVCHLPDGTYVVSVNKESTTVIINRR